MPCALLKEQFFLQTHKSITTTSTYYYYYYYGYYNTLLSSQRKAYPTTLPWGTIQIPPKNPCHIKGPHLNKLSIFHLHCAQSTTPQEEEKTMKYKQKRTPKPPTNWRQNVKPQGEWIAGMGKGTRLLPSPMHQ